MAERTLTYRVRRREAPWKDRCVWSAWAVRCEPTWRSFDPDGQLADEAIAGHLSALGAEVVRAARQFQTEGTCDYADDRQFAPHDHAVQPEASSPAS